MGYNTDILDDGNVSAYGKLVYFTLTKFVDKDGTCWPSLRTIASMAGISDKTVKKSINELIISKWIVKKKRKTEYGDYDSNLYILPKLGVGSDIPNVGCEIPNVGYEASDGRVCETPGVGSDVPTNLSILTYPININSNEQNVLDYLQTINGYPFVIEKDLGQVREWLSKYPADHILSELENFNSWWRDKSDSHTGKKNFRSSITNWLKKSKVAPKQSTSGTNWLGGV